jgi:hypothetical protein
MARCFDRRLVMPALALAVAPFLTLTAAAQTPEAGGAASPGGYPANVVETFVHGCIAGGGTQQACTCTLNAIQARYTLQEFAAISSQMHASGQVPSDITADIRACAVGSAASS